MKSLIIIVTFLSLVSFLPWPLQSQTIFDEDLSASTEAAPENSVLLISPSYDQNQNIYINDLTVDEGVVSFPAEGVVDFPEGGQVDFSVDGQIEGFAEGNYPPFATDLEGPSYDMTYNEDSQTQDEAYDVEPQERIPLATDIEVTNAPDETAGR